MALVRGLPHSPGHDPIKTAGAFVRAFGNHGVRGVYQFSNAVPFVEDPGLLKALDIWVDGGHYVGNHTYQHAPLSKMLSADYVREIERAEVVLKRYLERSPRRYFRYCAYQLGNTQCKVNNALGWLVRENYTPAPVTVGFDDAMFIMPHLRTTKYGTEAELEWLRDSYVECAVEELSLAAINAQKVFNRSPAQIWLIHGTSIAAECIDRILARFKHEGVDFISLDEALLDPMNMIPPPIVTTTFMFHIQMWGIAMGTPVEFPRPAIFDEVEKLHPRQGEMTQDMFKAAMSKMDARWTPEGTPLDHDC
ncbi:MAG: polysaccharide deacetylase family protein [Dehalococcoidia bacterium]